MVTGVTADRPKKTENTEYNPKILCASEFTSKCIQWHFTTPLRPFPCLKKCLNVHCTRKIAAYYLVVTDGEGGGDQR
jgi:hypothetical protein